MFQGMDIEELLRRADLGQGKTGAKKADDSSRGRGATAAAAASAEGEEEVVEAHDHDEL
jgi:hypothetical protein